MNIYSIIQNPVKGEKEIILYFFGVTQEEQQNIAYTFIKNGAQRVHFVDKPYEFVAHTPIELKLDNDKHCYFKPKDKITFYPDGTWNVEVHVPAYLKVWHWLREQIA